MYLHVLDQLKPPPPGFLFHQTSLFPDLFCNRGFSSYSSLPSTVEHNAVRPRVRTYLWSRKSSCLTLWPYSRRCCGLLGTPDGCLYLVHISAIPLESWGQDPVLALFNMCQYVPRGKSRIRLPMKENVLKIVPTSLEALELQTFLSYCVVDRVLVNAQ